MVRSDLRHSTAELHRYLLELDAFLDWENVYRRRIQGIDPPATKIDWRMGCFTYDANVVSNFVKAGLPVWFTQPVSKLIHARIDQLLSDPTRQRTQRSSRARLPISSASV